MNLQRAIYKNTVLFFAALVPFMLWGFWRKYFSNPFVVDNPYAHIHGIAMTLWVALLIGQAYLMRTGRTAMHRRLGKVSYGLAPIIVVAVVLFAHAQLRADGPTPIRLHILGIQVFLMILFVVSYGLAIYHRRDPRLHPRYMICMSLTLIDPIFARIIGRYLWTNMPYPWVAQVLTFTLTDLILVLLIVGDMKSERAPNVFPRMLGAFVVGQLLIFLVPHLPVWPAFAAWFGGLPLT